MILNLSELMDALQADYKTYYMTGFRDNDVALIDEVVRYPLTGSVRCVIRER